MATGFDNSKGHGNRAADDQAHDNDLIPGLPHLTYVGRIGAVAALFMYGLHAYIYEHLTSLLRKFIARMERLAT